MRSGSWNTDGLGSSGLKVSVLTLGTMTFGGKGNFAKVGSGGVAEVARAIDLCADHGVNLIDTADIYSFGHCEELIGEATGGKLKDGMLIATKARFPMGKGPNDQGLSRHHLIRACEASLRRLRVETIDLYQLHERDGETPIEETMEALDSLVRAGKVRYVGCSNFSGWHIMKAMEVARRDGRIPFVSQQIHYTLQAREAEYELIPISLDQGLGVMVWSPLAGGLALRQASPQRRRARGIAPARRLDRAADRRREQTVRHRRGAGRDRRGARRFRRAGRARLAARPPGGLDAHHRRAHRGAAQGQSRRRRAEADARKSAPGSTRSASRRCSIPTGTSPGPQRARLSPEDLSLIGPYLKK